MDEREGHDEYNGAPLKPLPDSVWIVSSMTGDWVHEDGGELIAAYDHKEPCGPYSRTVEYRRIPEPGSAEWKAVVERALYAYDGDAAELYAKASKVRAMRLEKMDAALRAALGLDQP